MKQSRKIIFFLMWSLLLIGGDRASKIIAKEHLQAKEPISYFHDTVRLEYVENTGAFLSWGAEWSQSVSFWVFSIMPLLFLIGLLIYAIRESARAGIWKLFSYILIFSGGIGNVIDRVFFNRHVSDFINVGFGRVRTGIFNFADLYVTTGVIILLWVTIREGKQPVENIE